MFFFFPLGAEGVALRLPVIGTLLALCWVLVFVPTYALNPNPDGIDRAGIAEAVDLWTKHPYLSFPKRLEGELDPLTRQGLSSQRTQWLQTNLPPGPEVSRGEQRDLDARAEHVFANVEHTTLRRLSLVPARGFAQLGWLTGLFVHLGWLQLVSDLLFLWVVAPLLEDAWGRGLFGGFYFAGGLAVGLLQILLQRHSTVGVGGAPGAVAACMGAFAVRFAQRRLKVAYVVATGFKLNKGLWLVPAWFAGVCWLGSVLFDLALGSGEAAVLGAQVGGFAVGAAAASVMKAAGLEKRFVATDEGGPLEASVLHEVTQARAALAAGQRQPARALLASALAKAPTDFDAHWELVRLDLEDGQLSSAAGHVERAVGFLVRDGQADRAVTCLLNVWRTLGADDFTPGFCFQLATASEASPEALDLTLALYRRAGDDPTAMGVKALVRYAERGLGHLEPRQLHEVLTRALARPELPKEIASRLRALEVELAPRLAEASAAAVAALPLEAEPESRFLPPTSGPEARLELATEPPGARVRRRGGAASTGSTRLRVVSCAVKAVAAESLTVEAGLGVVRAVPFLQVKAVSAAVLRPAAGLVGAKARLVVDLVLSWGSGGAPGTVVRLDSHSAGLQRFFPALAPKQVWLDFVKDLLQRSPALAIPDREALAEARFPSFGDEAELLEALARHAPAGA